MRDSVSLTVLFNVVNGNKKLYHIVGKVNFGHEVNEKKKSKINLTIQQKENPKIRLDLNFQFACKQLKKMCPTEFRVVSKPTGWLHKFGREWQLGLKKNLHLKF